MELLQSAGCPPTPPQPDGVAGWVHQLTSEFYHACAAVQRDEVVESPYPQVDEFPSLAN